MRHLRFLRNPVTLWFVALCPRPAFRSSLTGRHVLPQRLDNVAAAGKVAGCENVAGRMRMSELVRSEFRNRNSAQRKHNCRPHALDLLPTQWISIDEAFRTKLTWYRRSDDGSS